MKNTVILAGVFSAAIAAAASATTLTYSPGAVFGTIPTTGQTNEVLNGLGFGTGAFGFYGAQVGLSDDMAVDVTLDFFGYEAVSRNEFFFGGSKVFTTGGPSAPVDVAANSSTPLASTTITGVTRDAGTGLLDFSFVANPPGNPVTSAVNGSNPINAGGGAVNFFISSDNYDDYVWLFFDDNGRNDDDNHDDMVVRLSIGTPGDPHLVPLPATGMLLLAGLGAMGVARRRKKA